MQNIAFSSGETLNIFRICQEVVNNAIKHADASALKLSAYSDEKKFTISIQDNGKGFDRMEKKNGHYGLDNIQYRAVELNAELIIKTEQGKGTCISISRATNNANELLQRDNL